MRNWPRHGNVITNANSQTINTQWKQSFMFLKASEEFLDINFPNQHGLTPLMLAVRDVDLFESLELSTVYRPAEVLSELLRHHAWVWRVGQTQQLVFSIVIYRSRTSTRCIDCFSVLWEASPSFWTLFFQFCDSLSMRFWKLNAHLHHHKREFATAKCCTEVTICSLVFSVPSSLFR